MAEDVMARRPFGRTDLTVPPISVGCAPLGNMKDTFMYSVSEEDAVATIRAALASPINYIDTAALYGDGESERRVGLALRELGGLPEGAILQTKQGRDPQTNDYSGETVKRRLERSLELLGVDHFHVVYLHDAEWTTFDEAMAPGGPVEVLRSYRDQGVIGHLGVASGPNDVEIQYIDSGLFDAVITHNRYTLLNTSADPVIEAASQRGMAVLNAAPYGSGMLAKGPEAYPRYCYQQASDEMIARTHELSAICYRYGVPLPAAALQFSMRDPRIVNTIVGMSRPERIEQTVAFATHPIPDDLWVEIDALPPLPTDDPETNRWK
ncbi:MAG: D-threo-aldose 1-dehydrogenase [Thermomicrobiales bacterium]|nr:D-threo-aldose 1-dehydrogenase [Thermomicrobiales bacterium]